MKQDHVVIKELDGNLTIRIDDWELFDFIDDHLTDHDFDYNFLSEENVGDRRIFIIHLPDGSDANRLRAVIELIDPREIERIWAINN